MQHYQKNRILIIPAGTSNVYLIKNGKNSVLIDAGNKNKGPKILNYLIKHGVEPTDIILIVITHCHYDHVGSLNYLKEKTGADVLVHKKEEKNLRNGYKMLPDGTGLIPKVIVWIGRRFFSSMGNFVPVEPDIIINKRFDPETEGINYYVTPTPGHTEGSISLILENEIAFVGDTAFNVMKRSIYPPFADNQKVLLDSWEFLLQTKVKYIYPGHGKPFKRERLYLNYEKARRKIIID